MATLTRMEFYREAFDRLLEGCQVLSQEWVYLYLNDTAVRHFRKTRQELLGQNLLEVYPGMEKTPMFGMLTQCLRDRQSARMTDEFDFGNGETGWFELSAEPVPEGILVMSIDITDQKRDAERIRRLNRTQVVLSNVNQAIVRTRDLGELFEKACRIAVDDGGFAMAWIGFTDDERHRIVPVASAGQTGGYLDKIDSWAHEENQAGCPFLGVLREENRVVCNVLPQKSNAPCRKAAYELGFRSIASFPLKPSGTIQGTVNFYSSDQNFFDADELELLDELAMDLSFAMEFAEKESLRREAEKALRENEEKFRMEKHFGEHG